VGSPKKKQREQGKKMNFLKIFEGLGLVFADYFPGFSGVCARVIRSGPFSWKQQVVDIELIL
jgi:hypothetical protein